MNDRGRDDELPADGHPDDEFLTALVEEWKAATPAPPAALEGRILRAVAAARQQDERGARPRANAGLRAATWPRPVWAAAGALAALLVMGSMLTIRATLLAPRAPVQAERLLIADALRDAESAEREHARAIARLEEIAAPILAKARDPILSSERAARLAALGNRLRFLDDTIAEINGFLKRNSGHAGARTTLLAAYSEKTSILRDVIALDREVAS